MVSLGDTGKTGHLGKRLPVRFRTNVSPECPGLDHVLEPTSFLHSGDAKGPYCYPGKRGKITQPALLMQGPSGTAQPSWAGLGCDRLPALPLEAHRPSFVHSGP